MTRKSVKYFKENCFHPKQVLIQLDYRLNKSFLYVHWAALSAICSNTQHLIYKEFFQIQISQIFLEIGRQFLLNIIKTKSILKVTV